MILSDNVILEGIVLGATPYKENSAIVSFATSVGLISIYARGVYKTKSSLKSFLIPGIYLKADLLKTNEDFYLARSVSPLEDHSALLLDYGNTLFVNFVYEVSSKLYRCGDMYPFHEVSLLFSALERGKDLLSVALLFTGTIYRSLGIEIQTKKCVRCGKTDHIISYSLEEGGFICKNCRTASDPTVFDINKLFVLKFCFMTDLEKMIEKKVFKKEGIEVLVEMTRHLASYFDLKQFDSIALLIDHLG